MWAIMAICLLAASTYGLNTNRLQEDRGQEEDAIAPISPTNDWDLSEALLLRYLLNKQWKNRLHALFTDDVEQSQRKRGYWKQCAFNAVSCFGK